MSRPVLPHRRLAGIDERLEHAAARPVIVPETIVLDYADPPVMPTGSATTLVADVPGPLLTA